MLARACQKQAALDEVWFIPTAIQPLKQHGPHATSAERKEMLNLAIRDQPAWRVSDFLLRWETILFGLLIVVFVGDTFLSPGDLVLRWRRQS